MKALLLILGFLILEGSFADDGEICGIGRATEIYSSLFHETMNRIIGGRSLMTGDFPWIVRLKLVYPPSISYCTGTLISSSYVLTAKHCTIVEGLVEIQVQYGSANVSELKSRTAKQWFHSDGDNYPGQDIALVKLDTPIEFDESVSVICLSRNKRPKTGDKAIVAGFGNIFMRLRSPMEAGQPVNSTFVYAIDAKVLNSVSIDVMDTEKCACTPCTDSIIETYEFCAGGTQHGTYLGDSGGPAMILDKAVMQWIQVGVTARGKLTTTNDPAIIYDEGTYTDVAQFCDWIEETTNHEVTCAP